MLRCGTLRCGAGETGPGRSGVATPRQEAVTLLDRYCGPEADDRWTAGTTGYGFEVEGWSRPGTVFAATGVHTLVVSGMTAAEAWREALAELRDGIQDCTEKDCEGCEG